MDPIDPFDEIKPESGLEDLINKGMTFLNRITLNSIIKFILLVILISAIVPLWHWITSDDEIIIQPIVIGDLGKDQSLRQEPITDLLLFDLNEIRNAYTQQFPSEKNESILQPSVLNTSFTVDARQYVLGASSNINLNQKNYPGSHITKAGESELDQLGIIGVAGASLPLGQMLLCSKELTHHRGRIISGSLQKYGSNLTLIAILVNDSSGKSKVNAYSVSQTLIKDNVSYEKFIPDMVEELAFKIGNDIIEENRPPNGESLQTWQAFRNLTLGQDAYNTYRSTGNVSYLDLASKRVLFAKRSEPYCPEPNNLINELSLAYLDINEYKKSFDLSTHLRQKEINKNR